MRGSIIKPGGRRKTYGIYWEGPPDPATGHRRQYRRWGFIRRKDAEAALRDVLSQFDRGNYVTPTKKRLGGYLDEWLLAIRTTVRPGTWESYGILVRAYIVPRLGSVHLSKLTPAQVNALYGELLAHGGKDGAGLSSRTVRYVHTVLHRALRDAVRWDLVSRNVASLADPPKQVRRPMSVWTREELKRFLQHVEADRLYACYLLAATTGMRRGELLGLRWQDLDLEAGRASIRQTVILLGNKPALSEPKTERGRRLVSLDPVTVAGLKGRRAAQYRERLAAGGLWVDNGLVFTWEDGAMLSPDLLSEWFDRHVQAAGLPRIRLHDLRHTYASLALLAGVPAKVVGERLGHASIAITLDTYSHVAPQMHEQAANQVAMLIFGEAP